MAAEVHRPGLLQYVLVVAALWLTASVLYYARDLLVPVIGAGFIAVLLVPSARWLEQRMSRTAASIICVGSGVAVITLLLLWFLFFQITAFYYDIPRMKAALEAYGINIKAWISQYANVAIENHTNLIADWASRTAQAAMSLVLTISRSVVYSTALCVFFIFYVLFFMMYRARFTHFVVSLVADRHAQRARDVLFQMQYTIAEYLRGVLTVIALLAVYNVIVLKLLSVPYATLWGIVSAVLYIIPYIGIVIGAIFPTLSALLLQQSPMTALLVILVYVINQAIENNILTPYIVGGHVRINPLFVLLAFFAGGQIWGIAGMILFLPMLSVVKVICDYIPALHPYGYVLGTGQESSQT